MSNPPDGITSEILNVEDAIRRIPRYAFRLVSDVQALAYCLDKIAQSRFWRWLPFCIVSSRDLLELRTRADKMENSAMVIGYAGHIIAADRDDIPNPWSVLDEP